MNKEKLVPQLRFKGFEGEWEKNKLNNVAIVKDGTHESPRKVGEGYPLITSKNLKNNKIDFSDVSYISKKDFNHINDRSKVDIGDILFGMIGTIGNPVRVSSDDFAIKNVALIKYYSLDSLFTLFLLQSGSFTNYIKKSNVGNTQKFISLNNIKKFSFLMPLEQEQQKIGSFLKKIDKLIELQEKKMNHNYIMKNFYIQNIIPSRNSSYPTLRFKGLETLWVKQLVDQLVHFNNGISGDVKLNGGRYKLTRIETISKEFVDITKLGFTNSKPSAEKILKKGDILFSNINSIEHIGKMAVFNLEIPIYHGINLLRMSPINNVNPYFIFYTLSKQEYKNWIISRSNKAVSQASINKSTLGNLDLLVPGYDEQNKIANFLTKIDKLIYFRKQKIEHLKQLKKGYLQKLFC